MSLPYFPVAYYDELGLWEHFFPLIKTRLPIHGVNLNLPEGDIMMPPISVKFLSHIESFWHESAEYTYKRPYLWLFVLKFTNFEIFKRDIKPKLKELVHTMEDKNIEWLIVFVPSFMRLVKSDHKNFLASYLKVSAEVKALLGKANITKFYCSSNKTFVDLSQPSCIKDEYWLDFIKNVGKGVSVGIQTAICSHLKASCIEMDRNFYFYSLNLYALSLLYEKIGVKIQASLYLEMIREKVDSVDICSYRENDLTPGLEINGELFCENLQNQDISKLFSLSYLTDTIFGYLLDERKFDKASFVVSSSVSILWSLYRRANSSDLLDFIYDYSDKYSTTIQGIIQGNEYKEISKENRTELFYNLACILNIKLCALICRDSCKSHPSFSEYLALARKVYECFAFAGYPCKALLFKHYASSFALILEKFELLNEIINQQSYWPSIDSVNKKILLTNYRSLSATDRIKNITEVCLNQWFGNEELEDLWKGIYELSLNSSAVYLFSPFTTHTLKSFKVTQGQFHEIGFLVISPLKFSLFFHRFTAKYSGDFGFNELSIENVKLNPGPNSVVFKGVAWNCGLLRLESLVGYINKFTCTFPVFSTFADVEPCYKVFRPTVSFVYVSENRCLVVIELKTFCFDKQDIEVNLNYPEGVDFKEEVDTITFTNTGQSVENKKISDKKVIIKDLFINGFLYMVFEASSKTLDSAKVSFTIGSWLVEASVETVLPFTDNLIIACSRSQKFLSVSISNQNDFMISIHSITMLPNTHSAGLDQLPLTLETSQNYYTFFEDPPSPTLSITYQHTLPPFKPFFLSFFKSSRSLEIVRAVNIT